MQELFHTHPCITNQSPKGANRKFFVLWHGKIHTAIWFGHYQMASNLTDDLPSCPLEYLHCLFPRDAHEFGHCF